MYNYVTNEDEPLYVMRHTLEANILAFKKEKYNIILKFVNNIFNINYKSLCKIKGLCFEQLTNEHVITVIDTFNDIIKKQFKIDIGKKYTQEPSKIIFPLLVDMLKTIDYFLSKKIIKTNSTKLNKITFVIIAK
jgi:hypothetical protein